LDFRQLEAYINVYELQSFSKVAEKMFLSQPSISAYISALEKELGTQLIYRSTKEFIPTKSGMSFYQYAKDMLSLRDKSIQSIRSLSESADKSIDILASSVPAQFILPEILGDFHKFYPDILFNLKQMDSLEVVNNISSYKSEIGFVGAKIENPNCVYKSFLSEKLIMIAPYEERFFNIDADNFAELFYNEYFIMRELGSGTRFNYEECFKNIGIDAEKFKISAQFDNTQSAIHAVSTGLGISIVSETAAKDYLNQNKIISLDVKNLPMRNFYTVLHKNRIQTPILDTFVEFVHSYNKAKAEN